MKRVLFTHSYFLRFDPKQWKQQQPYPPLATLYAAAALRKEGYAVGMFDTMFAKTPEEVLPKMESWRPDVLVIYDDGFNFLTKMCLTNMREAAFNMCALAKERGCQVVVCSSDATDHYEKYLDHGAGFIVTGEGEITLTELMRLLESGDGNASEIEGLVYRRDGRTVINRKRDVLRDLDSLAMPAWDLVDMKEYKRRWLKSSGYFSLNVSTTRGCPFHCNWCAKPIYGNRYHAHSPKHVVEELKQLTGSFGARHIWMTDDIFGLKPGWVEEFARLVKAEKLEFRFKIQSRVDLLLQDNTVASLAQAGCETVWVGAESGSQKILDAMEKGTQVEQIAEATRQLKKHGIRPAFFLQFGYPGETREDIDATLEMVAALMPDDIGVSVSYPLPGTKFFDKVADQLREGGKANWKDSDELAVMFQSTFQAPFYKELQRYLHKRFRLKQGLEAWKRFTQSPARIRPSDLKRMAAISYHLPGLLLHGRRMKTLEKTGPAEIQRYGAL
jgi:radical SAM superfamily enzyme YgiQ (UPF0313 family)